MTAVFLSHHLYFPRILLGHHRFEKLFGGDGESNQQTLATAYDILPVFTHDVAKTLVLIYFFNYLFIR